ncbi:MAG: hypothetical protein HUJ28_03670 [Chromatiales bacterium]|nr:hypothetical protein [Chromatiales bacterium]
MTRNSHALERERLLIAEEAARLVLDEGLEDFGLAKRKAAEHLGLGATRNLPRNVEVEAAVLERQSLFQTEEERAHVAHLRATALEAMRLFADYSPRLVGSALKGTAHAAQRITLHLFANSVEEVCFLLMDRRIPYDLGSRRLRFGGELQELPSVSFVADDVEIEAVVFSVDGIRQAPLSPVDGRPMRRASLEDVEALLREA